METLIITDKNLIIKLCGQVDIDEMHLHLNHELYRVEYEDNRTEYEITHWLPYYYKIKNILKENEAIRA